MIDYNKPIKCICGYEDTPNKWHSGDIHSPDGMASFGGWRAGGMDPWKPMSLFICPECGTIKAIFK